MVGRTKRVTNCESWLPGLVCFSEGGSIETAVMSVSSDSPRFWAKFRCATTSKFCRLPRQSTKQLSVAEKRNTGRVRDQKALYISFPCGTAWDKRSSTIGCDELKLGESRVANVATNLGCLRASNWMHSRRFFASDDLSNSAPNSVG